MKKWRTTMSKKCKAYSASKLGLEPTDNRKAFYAGWDAAIKEALAQPKQEPVCWEWRWFDTGPYTVTSGQWSEWKRVEPRDALQTVDDAVAEFKTYIANGYKYELRALYTEAPQQREWVGLTDEEIGSTLSDPSIAEIHQGHWLVLPYAYARAIEAKLRELNGGGV
jgi:hypothetical protein